MKLFKTAAITIASSALVLAGCTANGSDDSADEGAGADGKKVSFFVYTKPGSEFWGVVEQGAKDAAALYNVDLDIQYGNDDPIQYNNLIQTAITNKTDAIAISVPDNKAYTDSMCRATEANIPLITYNNNATEGKALDCQMAFVGQDFVDAGYTIGKRMIADHGIGEGDLVFTPVELPEAVYAVQRFAGVKKALDEVGARADLVGVGVDPAAAQTKIVQYLLGHEDTKAVIALGGTPHSALPAALEEARTEVPVGGFDLSPQVVKGIQDGIITASVDQQPYSQGFYAVAQLALNLQYGLYPSSMATGGTGLVEKSNVADVAELAGTIR